MSSPSAAFRTVPLTPDRWGDLEDLFGPQGACYGCWCIHFRRSPKERKALIGEGARALFEARVKAGPPPGMLAYADALAVGWLQVGPRAHVPEWNNAGRASAPLGDTPAADERVWAASCFFVRPRWRRRGVTSALLEAGIAFARARGARVLEACPMDTDTRRQTSGLYVGATPVFARAGFVEVARRKEGRPLMRLTL